MSHNPFSTDKQPVYVYYTNAGLTIETPEADSHTLVLESRKRNFKPAMMIAIGLVAVTIPMSAHAAMAGGGFGRPGDMVGGVNGVYNNVRNVQGGTYVNTPGSSTVFNGNVMTVGSGTVAKFRQGDMSGNLNGNGGNVVFNASSGIIVKGTIDASAVAHGGRMMGDGGTVTFNTPYLFQGGNVIANGVNGGQIAFNTQAAVSFAPGSRTEAMGTTGSGGVINVNSPNGVVDIPSTARITTATGAPIGSVNPGVINIDGGLVNYNDVVGHGTITMNSSNGVIRIVSTGNANPIVAKQAVDNMNLVSAQQGTPGLTAAETNAVKTRIDQIAVEAQQNSSYGSPYGNQGSYGQSGYGYGQQQSGYGNQGGYGSSYGYGQNSGYTPVSYHQPTQPTYSNGYGYSTSNRTSGYAQNPYQPTYSYRPNSGYTATAYGYKSPTYTSSYTSPAVYKTYSNGYGYSQTRTSYSSSSSSYHYSVSYKPPVYHQPPVYYPPPPPPPVCPPPPPPCYYPPPPPPPPVVCKPQVQVSVPFIPPNVFSYVSFQKPNIPVTPTILLAQVPEKSQVYLAKPQGVESPRVNLAKEVPNKNIFRHAKVRGYW